MYVLFIECADSDLILNPPPSVSCVVPSSCSALSCCVDVDFMSRTINTEIYIDPCTYTLSLTIEKLHVETSLLTYKWGEPSKFSLQGGIALE